MAFRAKDLAAMCGLCILAMACTPSSNSDRVVTEVPVGLTANSNLSADDKAEELAKQAEILITAQGFLEANRISDMALAADPNNVRARLIKATLGPILEMKGIFARIRPLMEKSNVTRRQYETALKRIQNEMPESNFKSFLLQGPADIVTETDLQNQIDSLWGTFEKLRVVFKSVKQTELTFKATTFLVPNLNERFVSACEIKEDDQQGYVLSCPPSEKRFDITLNRADFQNLQDAVSFYQVSLAAYASYDLSGAVQTSDVPSDSKLLEPQEVLQKLLVNPKFGKLRSSQFLRAVPERLLDYAAGIQWAMAHQKELCPGGYPRPKSRPGKFFDKGICAGIYFQTYLDLLTTALSGKALDVTSEREGKSHSTQIRPDLFFVQPLSDVRVLGIQKMNGCGQIQSVTDATFAGVFPNRDANEVLALRVGECGRK